MNERPVKFSATLHRIEVHAGPIELESGDSFRWLIWAQLGNEDSVLLWGYLLRATAGGFGQAQSLAFLLDRRWSEVEASEARAEFSTWVGQYAAEILWDTTRRALQSQASLMDFQFDFDVQAPFAELEFRDPENQPS